MFSINNKIILLGFFLICFSVNIYAADSTSSDVKKIESEMLSPTKVMMLSGLFPGLGHIYLKKPIKSIVYMLFEGFHIYQVVRWTRISRKVDETKSKLKTENWKQLTSQQRRDSVAFHTDFNNFNSLYPNEDQIGVYGAGSKRNKFYWWVIGIHIVNMLDAYVDAHLVSFPEDRIEISAYNNRNEFTLDVTLNF